MYICSKKNEISKNKKREKGGSQAVVVNVCSVFTRYLSCIADNCCTYSVIKLLLYLPTSDGWQRYKIMAWLTKL